MQHFIIGAAMMAALFIGCSTSSGQQQQVTTLIRTNSSGTGLTMEVFTRGGQTNLVRLVTSIRGVAQMRSCKFYHGGVLVGEYLTMPDSSVLTTEVGSPYSLIFKSWPSNDVSCAYICSKDRVVLDYFMATNGIFCPMDSAAVQDANKMTKDMSKVVQGFPK